MTPLDYEVLKLRVNDLIAERKNYVSVREDSHTVRNSFGRVLVRIGNALMTRPVQIDEEAQTFAVAHAR